MCAHIVLRVPSEYKSTQRALGDWRRYTFCIVFMYAVLSIFVIILEESYLSILEEQVQELAG